MTTPTARLPLRFRTASLPIFGLAVSVGIVGLATLVRAVAGDGNQDSWIARMLASDKPGLEKMGLKLEPGDSTHQWIATGPKPEIQRLFITVDDDGKVTGVSAETARDLPLKLSLEAFGLRSPLIRTALPWDPKSPRIVSRAEGLPEGWSVVALTNYVDFLEPKASALMDPGRGMPPEAMKGDWVRALPTGGIAEVVKRLGKPTVLDPSVADVYSATYRGEGDVASVGFGFSMGSYLRTGDSSISWVYIVLRGQVKSAEQALKVLGLTGAKLGKELHKEQQIYAVVGTGIRASESWMYKGEPEITMGLPYEWNGYSQDHIYFRFAPTKETRPEVGSRGQHP